MSGRAESAERESEERLVRARGGDAFLIAACACAAIMVAAFVADFSMIAPNHNVMGCHPAFNPIGSNSRVKSSQDLRILQNGPPLCGRSHAETVPLGDRGQGEIPIFQRFQLSRGSNQLIVGSAGCWRSAISSRSTVLKYMRTPPSTQLLGWRPVPTASPIDTAAESTQMGPESRATGNAPSRSTAPPTIRSYRPAAGCRAQSVGRYGGGRTQPTPRAMHRCQLGCLPSRTDTPLGFRLSKTKARSGRSAGSRI